jgi:hypothetical protein
MKYLKRFNENLNLSNCPYINADDDELSFLEEKIREQLGLPPESDEDYDDEDYEKKYPSLPGKLEIHGNQVYYDETDANIMKIMMGIFPNDFKNGKRIGFGEW